MSLKLKDSGSFITIRWIPRYDGMERFLHWAHTAAFFPLTLTGMVLFIPMFAPFVEGEAGQFVRLIHRICAVFFTAVPILYALFRPRRLVNTIRDLKFNHYDIDWFKAAIPYYLLGQHRAMPPQGRFNTGEKLNVIVLVTGTILFAITGFVMWFGRGVIPTEIYRAMVIIHDLTMIVTVNMFIIHFYLAIAHPLMWQSMVSMRFGMISESYAREHHSAWYYGEERARKIYEERKKSQGPPDMEKQAEHA